MERIFTFLTIFFLLQCSFLNKVDAQNFIPYKYWVSFTDKYGTPYDIDEPLSFLSPQAVERRISQGIEINEDDLPVNPAYVDSLAADTAVRVYYSSRWLNGALISTLSESSLQRIKQLSFVGSVKYVKPLTDFPPDSTCFFYSAPEATQEYECPVMAGNEMFFSGKNIQAADNYKDYFHLFEDPDYGIGRKQIELINGQALHKEGYFGQGKMIAVFDSGFENVDQLQGLQHLWLDEQIIGYSDFVEPDSAFFNSHNHGTLVLSVMGVSFPGIVLGTALEAQFFLIRTEDAQSEFLIEEYNWLAAAELADSIGADIINSSLGYSTFTDPIQNHQYADLDGSTTVIAKAANMAFQRGILVVNSAGNYALADWQYIGTPADSFGALAVGAVDSTGTRVTFSSVGPSFDGRIKPDVMAMGFRVVVELEDGSIGKASGTSFSSPLVAGMAACLWSKFPHRKAADIKKAIIVSSSQYFFPDSLMGFGIPDFGMAAELLEHDFAPDNIPMALFPNPFTRDSFLTVVSEENQEGKLEVFDSLGRLVFSQDIPLNKGYNKLSPFNSMPSFAQGIFIIRMSFSRTGSARILKAVKAI